MATLITRADGNFTDAATWSPAATGMIADSDVTAVAMSTSHSDSNSFILPAEEIDALLIKVGSISAAPVGNLNVILRNTTTSTDIVTVTIDASVWPLNINGWIIVPFTPFTPAGNTYIIRINRSSSSGGSIFMRASSGTNFDRMFRRTTTAAPASADQLIITGEYPGSTTLTSRTVTMNNTATTTFGAVVATYKEALFIGMGATLDWATTASTNFYLRFKGIFKICGSGVLQMYTATSGAGSLPSTSTAVLEMDCTAAGDSAIRLGGTTAALTGGTWTLNGQTRGTTGSITGATNATPIEITDTAHGYETGAGVVISGVGGNTAANGTWWITKTGANTYTLDDSVGNGTYTSGGTRVSRLASKMATTTTIGTDTISIGSLVNTVGTAVEWKEGAKFDTGWTGLVCINGTTYTISGTPTTTTMTLTATAGTINGGTFTKLGTGAPTTMKLGDTSFLAAGDIIGCGVSSQRPTDAGVGIVSTVDSATQVTLEGPPCEYIVKVTNGSATVTLAKGQQFPTSSWNSTSTTCTINGNAYTIGAASSLFTLTLTGNYSQASDDNARMQITLTNRLQNCIYMSGLSDASGDVRAETFLITRNVMVRSLGQVGNASGLFGLIQIGSTDAVVNWNYGEFSQLGSSSGISSGIDVNITTLGTFNCNFCTVRDWWVTSTSCFRINNSSSGYTINNNFFHNLRGTNAIGFTGGTSGTITINGNIFLAMGSSNTVVSFAPTTTILTQNTFVCCETYSIIMSINGSVLNTANNTIHSSHHAYRASVSPVYGKIGKSYIWRLSVSSPQGVFNTVTSGTTNQYLVLEDWTIRCIGNSTNGAAFYVGTSNIILVRPVFEGSYGGYASNNNYLFSGQTGGTLTVYDGELGLVSPFINIIYPPGGTAGTILFYNTRFSSTSTFLNSTNNLYVGSNITSIKHNGVAGDNRIWSAFGAIVEAGSGATDTSIYNRESPSVRLYPNNASHKMQIGPLYIPVKSGINPTISIKVRKSATGSGDAASYNGNSPRLILLANTVLGYTCDTSFGYSMYSAVLATASGSAGAWETLTATLPTTPTEDGVVSVVVDLDGTEGWINIDDFYVDSPNTGGMKNWAGDFAGPLVAGVIEPMVVKRRRKAR